MRGITLLFTVGNCSHCNFAIKWATSMGWRSWGIWAMWPGPCRPHPAMTDHRTCPKAVGKESPPSRLCRPGPISTMFAEISSYSFPGVHAEDTQAGREFLLLFKLCKNLKSHFIFQSGGRMPPNQEASLKDFFSAFLGGWGGVWWWGFFSLMLFG